MENTNIRVQVGEVGECQKIVRWSLPCMESERFPRLEMPEEDMLNTGCCGLRRGPLVSQHHPLASLASALQWAEAEQVLPERCAGVKGRLSDLPISHQN